MDQQQSQSRGRSPSANSSSGRQSQQQPHIKNQHSPSRFPIPAGTTSPAGGLGLGLELELEGSAQQFGTQPDFSTYDPSSSNFLNAQQTTAFGQAGLADPTASFDLGQDFAQQLKGEDPAFGRDVQGSYSPNLLAPNFGDADFPIFPQTVGEQFGTPLFIGDNQQLGDPDNSMMTPSQPHSPTTPHLLKPDPHSPSSANHSPVFNQHQFSSSPGGGHSRNVSLGPEAALLPGQIDWSQAAPQFHVHRRSPSEYSDVSSVGPHSPHLVSSDAFDPVDQSHSPMQQPQDVGLYSELHGISHFSISDHGAHSPNQHAGRSPSHSPAVSPRIHPQQLPDMTQQNPYLLQPQDAGFGPPPAPFGMQAPEAFPTLVQNVTGPEMQAPMQAPPAINIDFAPPAAKNGFDQSKSMDADSLTPPERGRPRSRPRAVTDPFNSGGALLGPRSPSASGSLYPNPTSDTRSESSRSLSPLDRSATSSVASSPSRRRQSTSAVPNNVMALRLADPDYNGPGSQGDGVSGGSKRAQKHPATFQCTLCPKRFTRAYNLRSHFRTHTDERPFVCTVCNKAFARQHDRKRHEGLHSGEKKFVCKGELSGGGSWGCGRRFARADALGRHFRSEAGGICIKPLLDEEYNEKRRAWNEQQMQQAAAQGMVMQPPGGIMMSGMDLNAGGFPMETGGNYVLPQALLEQYPALATMNWSSADMAGAGSGIEDDLSGRSSFDASDYEEGDDAGYVSGPGTGFGPGGISEGFGEVAYASDYGGR